MGAQKKAKEQSQGEADHPFLIVQGQECSDYLASLAEEPGFLDSSEGGGLIKRELVRMGRLHC